MTTGIDWKALSDAYGEGASDVEIAKMLDITISAFYQLEQEQPAFAKFVEKGRTYSQAWWYTQSRTALRDKSMNVTLLTFNLKNRFGWADKTDIQDTTDKDPVNLDKAKSELYAVMKKISKTNPELYTQMRQLQGDNNDGK